MYRLNYFRWTLRFYFNSFANLINISFILFIVFMFAIPSTVFWSVNSVYNPRQHSTLENFQAFDRFFSVFFDNIFPLTMFLLIFLVIIINISYVYEMKKSSVNDLVTTSISKFFQFSTILIITFSFYVFYSCLFLLASGLIMLIFIQSFSPITIFAFLTQLKINSFSDIYGYINRFSAEQFCYLPFSTVIFFSCLLLFLNGFLYVLLTTGLAALSNFFLDIFLFVVFIFILPIVLKNLINLIYNNVVHSQKDSTKNIIFIVFTIIPIISNGYLPVYLVEYHSTVGPDVLWPIFVSIGIIFLTNLLMFFLMKRFYYFGIFSFVDARIWKNLKNALFTPKAV